MEKLYIITGGLGFIGNSLIKKILTNKKDDIKILIFDKKLIDEIDEMQFSESSRLDYDGFKIYSNDNIHYHKENLENYFDNDSARYTNKLFNTLIENFIKYNYGTNIENLSDGNDFEIQFIHCASPVGVSIHLDTDLFSVGYNMSVLVANTVKYFKSVFNLKITLSYTSTSEVYGNINLNIKKEISDFINTHNYDYFNKYLKNPFKGIRSTYLRQKLASELLFLSLEDIDVKIFRLFNIFGSDQNPNNGVVPLFTKKLSSEQDDVIYYGNSLRTYTHIDYAIEYMMKIIDSEETGLFNVVSEGNCCTDKFLIDNLLKTIENVNTIKLIDISEISLLEAMVFKIVQNEVKKLWDIGLIINENIVKVVKIQIDEVIYKKYIFNIVNPNEITERVISDGKIDNFNNKKLELFNMKNLVK